MTSSPHPFNIKAVVRETGVLADTIRAWERRFGIPSPMRTEGGHRRYSRHDIDIILWLKHQTQRGLSISAAVAQFQALLAEGKDPLSENTLITPAIAPVSISRLEDLRTQWVDACLAYNDERAESLASEAFAQYAPEEVVFHILLAGLAEIGAAWQASRATVQQEHFTSQLVTRRLEALIATAPRPTRPERMAIALPPGGTHIIPSLAILYLLRMRSFPVTNLGASVPIDQILEAFSRIQPTLTIISAQTLPRARELQQMAHILSGSGYHVAFGGGFFIRHPQAQRSIPGTFLGESLKRLPDRVEHIIQQGTTPSIPTAMTQENAAALQILLQSSPSIERGLWEHLEPRGWDFFELNQMFLYLNALLDAALSLGSLTFLGGSQQEFLTLLTVSGIRSEPALEFLTAYQTQMQVHNPILGRRLQTYLNDILRPRQYNP